MSCGLVQSGPCLFEFGLRNELVLAVELRVEVPEWTMHQHILDTEIAAYLGVNESDGIIWSFFGIFLVVVGAMVSGEVDVVVRGIPAVAEEATGLTVGSESAAKETDCFAGFLV